MVLRLNALLSDVLHGVWGRPASYMNPQLTLCLASFLTPRSSNPEFGDSKSVSGTTSLLHCTLEAILIFSLTSLEFFYNECALLL